ncbi:glycosyltransferase family 4 protein [bacterium]|nr:glycosyltransferase family 4 protein [bacterium]
MRVAVDARALIAGGGGINRYASELMRALPALGVEVTAWVAGWHREQLSQDVTAQLSALGLDLPVHAAKLPGKLLYDRLGPPLWPHWQRCLRCLSLFPRDVDLFHAPQWPFPLTQRPPSVLTIHDLIGLRHPDWVPPMVRAIHRSVAALAPRAAQVIVDSEAVRADVLDLCRLAPERVTAVPLGVCAEAFARSIPPEQAAAVGRRYAADRPYFLTVSTIEPRKNLTTLLQAYDLLCERRLVDWDLHIVGRRVGHTPEFEELLARPRPGVVRITTYAPGDDLAALVQGAGCLAFISRAEGFGLPVLEAFAAGCPVVAANATSLPEVAGDAALLVDPTDPEAVADALLRVASDPALADELRRRGRARAAEFTWERTACQTLDVYRKALA